MVKRGQITLFIIVGIIILAVAVSFFYIKSELAEKKAATEAEETSLAIEPIKMYVENCIEETAKDALVFIGKHGGYYELPPLSDSFFLMPYYFYDDKNHLISKEELEEQISQYADNALFFCIKNFVVFEKQGYEIKQEDASTTTTIAKNKVIFNVNFPITVKKGEVITSIVEFTASIDSRLGIIHNVIEKFLQDQENDPASICVSCAAILGIEHDLRVEMSFIEEGEIMFTVIDEKVPINERPFEYNFINKYEFG